jgi:hypothetical protein
MEQRMLSSRRILMAAACAIALAICGVVVAHLVQSTQYTDVDRPPGL